MRVVVGLLLLLLGLCGSGAQGEGGGLGEVAEITEKTAPKDPAEESTEQITEKTTCDIWTELRALRYMVVELNVHVELLQRENSELQTRLSSSESRTEQLERENAVQATELTSLGTRLTATESKTSDLEKENAEKPKVAFHTGLNDDGQLGPYNTDITLKFSKVVTNIGNAYSPSTGFFTAPVRGVYNLQFTVCGYFSGKIGVYVYKNNRQILYNFENNNNDSDPEYLTKSLVLELIAGDEIHLILPSGHSVFDSWFNHSTFSGSLLFTL